MNIPNRLKQVMKQIVNNASKQRKLNTELTAFLEDIGVDFGDEKLIDAIAYLEGDCTTQPLIEYLESL